MAAPKQSAMASFNRMILMESMIPDGCRQVEGRSNFFAHVFFVVQFHPGGKDGGTA
jgi:hypothetical protein